MRVFVAGLVAVAAVLALALVAITVGRSVPAVSHALAKLRLAEVVRFDRSGRSARYRIKYSPETKALLAALGDFEKASRDEKLTST